MFEDGLFENLQGTGCPSCSGKVGKLVGESWLKVEGSSTVENIHRVCRNIDARFTFNRIDLVV